MKRRVSRRPVRVYTGKKRLVINGSTLTVTGK